MINKKLEVIEFSKRLNSTNLSPLRSGNISARSDENGIQGFLITPSGKKYLDFIMLVLMKYLGL